MAIEHKCKITVLECKCYKDYQEKYLADPNSGPCPCFKPGDEFLLERNGKRDDFYTCLMANSALKLGMLSVVMFMQHCKVEAL